MTSLMSKKKDLYIGLWLLVLCAFVLAIPSEVFAANDASTLPDVKYFTPNLEASLETVDPILRLINWAAGIFGLVLIVMGTWKTLKIVWEAFTSKQGTNTQTILDQLKVVLFGVVLTLFAITGVWYKLLIFLWEMIVPQIVDGTGKINKTSWDIINSIIRLG